MLIDSMEVRIAELERERSQLQARIRELEAEVERLTLVEKRLRQSWQEAVDEKKDVVQRAAAQIKQVESENERLKTESAVRPEAVKGEKE